MAGKGVCVLMWGVRFRGKTAKKHRTDPHQQRPTHYYRPIWNVGHGAHKFKVILVHPSILGFFFRPGTGRTVGR
jgi:hypothetical protein